MSNDSSYPIGSVHYLQAASEQLFDHCFREYYPALCLFAHSYLKDEEAAADLVQDCFLALWESGTLAEKKDHLQAFLYTLVRNRCIDTLRRKQVQEKRIGAYNSLVNQWQEEDSNELTRTETIRQLHAAIETLPEETRAIIRQHFFENRRYTDIAKDLQSNYETVRKQGARAIIALKKQIRPLVLLLSSFLH